MPANPFHVDDGPTVVTPTLRVLFQKSVWQSRLFKDGQSRVGQSEFRPIQDLWDKTPGEREEALLSFQKNVVT